MHKPDSITYGKLVLVQVLWGGTFVASELALRDQPPLTTAAIRFFFTGFAYVLLMHGRLPLLLTLPRQTKLPLIFMGFFGVFTYTILLHYGLALSKAANAALLIPTTQPIFTTVLSAVAFRQRPSTRVILALFLGLIGAMMVIWEDGVLSSEPKVVIGDLLILAAALSFACYSVAGKFASQHIDSKTITLASTLIGTLMLLPTPFLHDAPMWNLDTPGWQFTGAVFYLVVFATVIPYLWWNESVQRIGPAVTGFFTFLLPPIALFIAAVVLGQGISAIQAIGGGITLIAVAITMNLHEVVLSGFRKRSHDVPAS